MKNRVLRRESIVRKNLAINISAEHSKIIGYTLHVYPEQVINLFVRIIERFTRSQRPEAYEDIYLTFNSLTPFLHSITQPNVHSFPSLTVAYKIEYIYMIIIFLSNFIHLVTHFSNFVTSGTYHYINDERIVKFVNVLKSQIISAAIVRFNSRSSKATSEKNNVIQAYINGVILKRLSEDIRPDSRPKVRLLFSFSVRPGACARDPTT